MQFLKSNFTFIIATFLYVGCSSAQQLQKKSPIKFEVPYCHKWISGVKGGGSGLNLFIPISKEIPENVQLDSVYFRGESAKLEALTNGTLLYVGRFETSFNQKQDIIMSSDPTKEYGNQLPDIKINIPFKLNDSECVISYKEDKKVKYFKIENIVEKQVEHYPSAPPNKY